MTSSGFLGGLLRLLRASLRVVQDFLRAIQEHALFTHAAAVAFFLFLSLPPCLLALVSLVGLVPIDEWTERTTYELFAGLYSVLGQVLPEGVVDCLGLGVELRFQPALHELEGLSSVRVQTEISSRLHEVLPPGVAKDLDGIVANVLGNPRKDLLTVSFLTILWSASGVTRAAMRALSTIYEVRYRSLIGRNALSLVLTVGFLATWTVVLALLPLSGTLAVIAGRYFGLDSSVEETWRAVNWFIGGGMLLFSVLLLNRLGPDVELRLRALLPGSLASVGLWVLLTRVLADWLGTSWQSYNSTYGTLAAIIVLLLWCYLMSIGFLLGAELNTAILRLRRRGLEAAGEDLRAATRDAVEAEVSPIPATHVERAAPAAGIDEGGGQKA